MDGLVGPGRVDLGRVFELKAIIKNSVDTTARLRLFRDRDYLSEREVALSVTKKDVFTFPQALDSEGVYVYEALIEPSVDAMRENNRARALVIAAGKPKVLYVTRDVGEGVAPSHTDYLHRALVQKGMEIVLLTDPSGMPTSLSEMQNYSTVIFNDISAYSLSTAQMKMIESYVHDLGGGFVMIGGENSFGSGGYYKTPIGEVLPVKMVPERKKQSLSIALAIDRSGSMAAPSGRYVKLDLAKEAAVSVVEFLTGKDQIGVIAFDAEAQEIVRLEKVRAKGKIEDKIGTIRAGGGTDMYPALEIAYKRLLNADTQLKHVILVSDGKSQRADDAYALVGEMARDKITVSTIAIGGDADREVMQLLWHQNLSWKAIFALLYLKIARYSKAFWNAKTADLCPRPLTPSPPRSPISVGTWGHRLRRLLQCPSRRIGAILFYQRGSMDWGELWHLLPMSSPNGLWSG